MAMIEIDDLMGIKELSDALKAAGYPWCERTNLTTWIARRDSYISEHGIQKTVPNGFPLPVRSLAMGGLYSYSAVLEWVIDHYGQPGAEQASGPVRGSDLDIALKRRPR